LGCTRGTLELKRSGKIRACRVNPSKNGRGERPMEGVELRSSLHPSGPAKKNAEPDHREKGGGRNFLRGRRKNSTRKFTQKKRSLLSLVQALRAPRGACWVGGAMVIFHSGTRVSLSCRVGKWMDEGEMTRKRHQSNLTRQNQTRHLRPWFPKTS